MDDSVNVQKSLFSIWQYVLTYYQKLIKSKSLLTILCSLVISFYILSTTISAQIIAKQEEMLSALVNTEIVISKNFDSFYAPEIPPMHQEVYEKIIHMENVKGYVPIMALSATVQNHNVDILPYSELMNMEEFQTQGNIYISYELSKLIKPQQYPFELITDITLPSDQQKTVTETFYIHNAMKSIYANVHQLKLSISAILGMGSVDFEFVDMSSINESTTAFTTYLKVISISLYVMLWLMLIVIYSRYMINREYEFCILKSGGLTKQDILKLMLSDIFIQSIFFTVVAFFMIIASCETMKLLKIIGTVTYRSVIMPTLIVSCGCLVLPTLIAVKKVNQFSPAKFLRQ